MSARPDAMPLGGVLARWDALCVRWALDGPERSALIGGGASGEVDDVAAYDAAGAERRMRLLIALEVVVEAVHGDEARTRAWLRRTNPNLGHRTPIEVMATSSDWIRWLVDAVGVSA